MAENDPWLSREVPTLRGSRVVLRRLKPADMDDRQRLGQNAEERRMYGLSASSDEPMTVERGQAWYETGSDNPTRMRWAIEYDGRCIGSCDLRGTGSARRYSIGISDRSLWGIGLGTECTRLVLGYAFGLPGVERVELMVLAFNARAIRSYEKCGFRVREVLKDHAEIDGQHYDDWLMDVDRVTHSSPVAPST